MDKLIKAMRQDARRARIKGLVKRIRRLELEMIALQKAIKQTAKRRNAHEE